MEPKSEDQDAARTGTIPRDEFARLCPLAWNTHETKTHYARLGFRLLRRLFRQVTNELDGGEVTPQRLPVARALPVEITGVSADGFLLFEVGEATSDEPFTSTTDESDEVRGPCRSSEDKPFLDADYLRAHRPIAWNYRDMTEPYASLGYAAARAAVRQILESEVEKVELPCTEPVRLTLDTTRHGGGCTVICVKDHCVHQPNDSSNQPGGGGG